MFLQILLSAEGPHSNIIKIKPPMCFSKENVDKVIYTFCSFLHKLVIKKIFTTLSLIIFFLQCYFQHFFLFSCCRSHDWHMRRIFLGFSLNLTFF